MPRDETLQLPEGMTRWSIDRVPRDTIWERFWEQLLFGPRVNQPAHDAAQPKSTDDLPAPIRRAS